MPLRLVPLLLLLAATARAELADTPWSLKWGNVSLAGEFQIQENRQMQLNFHESVGLRGGIDLVLRQSVGLQANNLKYVGGALKWSRALDRSDDVVLAVWAGGHWIVDSHAGADVTLMIGGSLGGAAIYGALDMNLEFTDAPLSPRLGLLGGLRLGMNTNFAWFLEGLVPLNDGPFAFSTGPKFYF